MGKDVELDLIRRAQGGDERAFEAIVDAYQAVLFNLTLRMTGNREDARDLTQTVFLKAWRNLVRFDGNHRFFSWIYRIALNESLNFVQRRRQHAELEDRTPEGRPGPDADVETGELHGHIQEALMELSEEHRQVIVLRHVNDLSYQEIGEVLSLPEKTVKSRLFTARQRLGAILARRGVTSA